jgi:hypothetical protein
MHQVVNVSKTCRWIGHSATLSQVASDNQGGWRSPCRRCGIQLVRHHRKDWIVDHRASVRPPLEGEDGKPGVCRDVLIVADDVSAPIIVSTTKQSSSFNSSPADNSPRYLAGEANYSELISISSAKLSDVGTTFADHSFRRIQILLK